MALYTWHPQTRSNEIGLVQNEKNNYHTIQGGMQKSWPEASSATNPEWLCVLDFLCEPLRLDGAFVTGHMAFGICRERAACFRVLHWILYGIEYLKTSSNPTKISVDSLEFHPPIQCVQPTQTVWDSFRTTQEWDIYVDYQNDVNQRDACFYLQWFLSHHATFDWHLANRSR